MRSQRQNLARIVPTLGLLALGLPAASEHPPPDLLRRLAARETGNERARQNYTYRQSIAFEELDRNGRRMGVYREAREVIFSLESGRTERMTGRPELSLQRIRLTEEDYRDFREVQPALLTEDQIWLYRGKVLGPETVEGEACWAVQVSPKQILDGQRLFEGRVWVRRADYSIVRMEGKAVPQFYGRKENLFPYFVTLRKPVEGGYWFPALTLADDTLAFRSGPQRIRLEIKYEAYKRFGADSTIHFEQSP